MNEFRKEIGKFIHELDHEVHQFLDRPCLPEPKFNPRKHRLRRLRLLRRKRRAAPHE